tara:strand:+ start:1492 stop:1644 length:153 start_codon:yes stop_codon:yes gene_type:complete
MEQLDTRDYNLLLSVLLKEKLNQADRAALDLVKLKLLYKVNKLNTHYEFK